MEDIQSKPLSTDAERHPGNRSRLYSLLAEVYRYPEESFRRQVKQGELVHRARGGHRLGGVSVVGQSQRPDCNSRLSADSRPQFVPTCASRPPTAVPNVSISSWSARAFLMYASSIEPLTQPL